MAKPFGSRTVVLTTLMMAGAMVAQPAAGQATAEKKADAPDQDAVTEILVTARRETESLQDVPLALSVISGDRLEAQGISNLTDLYLQVPVLRVVNINPRNAALTIRGIGANLANESLVNSVGVFVDGVYHARPGAAAFGQYDIEQIEVLRGPQGTLFGKNTTAGALNISTRVPTFSPEGRAEMSLGDYGHGTVAATASARIVGNIAGRLTYSGRMRDGIIADREGRGRFNDLDEQSIRGQLLWEAGADVTGHLEEPAVFGLTAARGV